MLLLFDVIRCVVAGVACTGRGGYGMRNNSISKWLQISKHTCEYNNRTHWIECNEINQNINIIINWIDFHLLGSSKLKDHMCTKSVQCITHKFLARNYWNIDLKTITMDQYDRSPCIPFHFLSYVQSENKMKAIEKLVYWIFYWFERVKRKTNDLETNILIWIL